MHHPELCIFDKNKIEFIKHVPRTITSGGGFPYDEMWERYKHMVVYPITLDLTKVSPEVKDRILYDTVGKIKDGTITRNKLHMYAYPNIIPSIVSTGDPPKNTVSQPAMLTLPSKTHLMN